MVIEQIRAVFQPRLTAELIQAVLSHPVGGEVTKLKLRPVAVKGSLRLQAEEFRGAQVFHKNYTAEEALAQLETWLIGGFRQAWIQTITEEITLLIGKKGKNVRVITKSRLLQGKRSVAAPCENEAAGQSNSEAAGQIDSQAAGQASSQALENLTQRDSSQSDCVPEQAVRLLSHNRVKRYLLQEGVPTPFLVELGVMTAQGQVVHAKYDKFRQINRFLEFVADCLPTLKKQAAGETIRVIDFGCGKSYLTFALYDYLHERCGLPVRITGLDLKPDVIRHCAALAQRCGYQELEFLQGDIAGYEQNGRVDMVVSLHACDTATDAALKKAVEWEAGVILCVPCCQHELNGQLNCEALQSILKYGLLKERIAALLTDGLRANWLEEQGYRVQVMEFIDMAHTPKNILLRAIRRANAARSATPQSIDERRALLQFLNVEPAIYRD